MSVWRSPLLYFGIILILVAAAAFSAPYYLDWNRFRGDIEAFGRDLTGRQVTVAGDISAKLFPWPVLTLNNVRIANPHGARHRDLLRSETVRIKMALAPLLSGTIKVEGIRVVRPIISLEQMANGTKTWSLAPATGASDILNADRLTVSGIEIDRGTVVFSHARLKETHQIDDLTASLSSPALDGPWRLRGEGKFGGDTRKISVSTGKLRPEQPFKLALRVSPEDESGWTYSFDGEVSDKVTGSIKVMPIRAADGRADPNFDPPDVVISSDVEADFKTVNLKKIEISSERRIESGNLLTGDATIVLGSTVTVTTQLKAAQFDLDQTFANTRSGGISGGDLLRTIGLFMSVVPVETVMSVGLEVNSLVSGGETLSGFALKGDISSESFRIKELSALMPGQTRGSFSGIFLPGENKPQLSGILTLDSLAVRDFAMWYLPDARKGMEKVWTGARGRLTVSTSIDATPERLRLHDGSYAFDDAKGTGNFSFKGGANPSVVARVVVDELNVDRYAPDGLTTAGVEGGLTAGLIDLIGKSMALGDFTLTLQSDEVAYRGTTARDVAINLVANDETVELRTVQIGDFQGARIDFAGLLKFPDDGISGTVTSTISARDPSRFLALTGVEGPRLAPGQKDWRAGLAPVELKIVSEARTDNDQTRITGQIIGKAGTIAVNLDTGFEGRLREWQKGHILVTGNLSSDSSQALAGLAGVSIYGERDSPAELIVSARGRSDVGLVTTADFNWLDTSVKFAGTFKAEPDKQPAVSGRLAILAERAHDLYSSLGLSTVKEPSLNQVLSLEGEMKLTGNAVEINNFQGSIAGSAVLASLALGLETPRRLTGNLELGHLNLGWLLGTQLFSRSDGRHSVETRFDLAALSNLSTDVGFAVRRLDILPTLAWRDARMHLKNTGRVLEASINGRESPVAPRKLSLKVERGQFDASLSGKFEGPVALDRLLVDDSGYSVLTGKAGVAAVFSGQGRTPAAIRSSLFGSGTYKLVDAAFGRLDVTALAQGLRGAASVKEVDGNVKSAMTGKGSSLSIGSGRFTISGGVVDFARIPVKFDAAEGTLKLLMELASNKVDFATRLKIASSIELPEVEITYAGSPQDLTAVTDVSSFKEHVNMRALAQGISELERLQREQTRLLREESEFERMQVMRQRLQENERRQAEEAEKRAKAEEDSVRVDEELKKKQAEERARKRREAEERRKKQKAEADKRKAEAERLAAEERRKQIELEAQRQREERRKRQIEEAEKVFRNSSVTPIPKPDVESSELEPLPATTDNTGSIQPPEAPPVRAETIAPPPELEGNVDIDDLPPAPEVSSAPDVGEPIAIPQPQPVRVQPQQRQRPLRKRNRLRGPQNK